MGKLILAIITVACLQVAFVIYIVVDNPADIIAYVPDPRPADARPDLSAITAPDQIDEPAYSAAAVLPSKPGLRAANPVTLTANDRRPSITKPHTIAVIRNRRPHHIAPVRPAERHALRPRPETFSRKGFTDTVILYNRNGALTEDRATNIPKAKKRSFIAKAMPIVKKPWDLIKGIASKLN